VGPGSPSIPATGSEVSRKTRPRYSDCMARALVIGGTLFIGRALVRRLLARGDEVTILHRGKANPFGDKAEELHCDRNDTAAIAAALEGGQWDLVFDNVYDWARGTTSAQVEAAARTCPAGLRRYVFTSSVAAYGEGLDRDEDDPLAAPDFADVYCRNKAETERMLFRLHRESGFPAVTVRPPYVYGPENPFYREAFFWDRILAERPVLVPGDGQRLMQFVLADDIARAALLACEEEAAIGRAYNIAAPRAISQNELVTALAQAAGREVRMVHVPREKLVELGGQVFQPPFYFGQYFDMEPITQRIDRARAELGFEPTPFEAGLQATFEWYVGQDAQERPTPDFSYDEKALEAIGAV